jgi:electron transport complex protein RnfE
MTPGRSTLFSSSVLKETPRGPAGADSSLLFLGLCPAIAVSVRVIDALWMSAGVTFVLVLSSLAMSLLAREGGAGGNSGDDTGGAPGWNAGPAGLLRALIITSLLTTFFEAALLVQAPSVSASLGIYAPLIAVNCLVLGFDLPGTSRSAPGASVAAALRRGIGFAMALVLIALVREVIGAGTITLFPIASFGGTIAIPGLVEQPARALGGAGGALLCLGYLAAAARAAAARPAAKSERGGSTR